MSPREHEEVALEEQRYENGEVPQLLDIIDIPLVAPRPRLHRPENWLLNPNFYWNKVGRFEVNRLPSLLDAQGSLWINGHSTYNSWHDDIRNDEMDVKDIFAGTGQQQLFRDSQHVIRYLGNDTFLALRSMGLCRPSEAVLRPRVEFKVASCPRLCLNRGDRVARAC